MTRRLTTCGALTLLLCACSVPDLKIEEAASPTVTTPGPVLESDAAVDAGSPVLPVEPIDAGSPPVIAPPTAAGSGGAVAVAPPDPAGAESPPPTPPPSDAEPEAGVPMEEPRNCVLWRSVDARDETLPEGTIEGGLETVAGVPTKQYVCRFRPQDSAYAIPGKYVVGLGCYVTRRVDGRVLDASALDGRIDVLTRSPGCTFSWRTAGSDLLPAEAIDLGEPVGAPHYACRGSYSGLASSGIQIGAVIESISAPKVHECWFQSFDGASQAPMQFEVLALDARTSAE